MGVDAMSIVTPFLGIGLVVICIFFLTCCFAFEKIVLSVTVLFVFSVSNCGLYQDYSLSYLR